MVGLIQGALAIVNGIKAVRQGVSTVRGELGRLGLVKSNNVVEISGMKKKPRASIKRLPSKIEYRTAAMERLMLLGLIDKSATVRRTAAEILSQKCGEDWCVPARDYMGEISAIYNAVKQLVRYTKDAYSLETFQSPQRTLEMGIGDCDDMTTVLGSLLLSVGYPVKIHVVQTRDPRTGRPYKSWNHVMLKVGLPPEKPSKWIPLDPTIEKAYPGWYPKKIVVKSFDHVVKPTGDIRRRIEAIEGMIERVSS